MINFAHLILNYKEVYAVTIQAKMYRKCSNQTNNVTLWNGRFITPKCI